MKNMLEKLWWYYEEENAPSQQISDLTDKFHEEQKILMGQLGVDDLEIYKKVANIKINMTSIIEKESFTNGMKFGAKLMLELLV